VQERLRMALPEVTGSQALSLDGMPVTLFVSYSFEVVELMAHTLHDFYLSVIYGQI
jgi:hypothetical protein